MSPHHGLAESHSHADNNHDPIVQSNLHAGRITDIPFPGPDAVAPLSRGSITLMRKTDLASVLDTMYRTFHSPRFLGMDPLCVVRQCRGPEELEITGLLASCLSYGRVARIIASIRFVRERAGEDLAGFTLATSYRHKLRALRDFSHRFNRGDDVALLLECVKVAYREHGSLEGIISRRPRAETAPFAHILHAFSSELISWSGKLKRDLPRSYRYLLPSPRDGSACKRLCMYFRWMVRGDDGVDCGVWNSLSPAQLVMPVDTHIHRIARKLGLTQRNTADWKAAEEITAALRTYCPHDPVKFDFSLCRWGMRESSGE